MIARKYFQWEKQLTPSLSVWMAVVCLFTLQKTISVANVACQVLGIKVFVLVTQGPGCVTHPFPQGWQSLHYVPSASLAGSLRDHLRGFLQIDEPKRGPWIPGF